MQIDSSKLFHYLDTLCNRGCSTVREIIRQLETGNRLSELSELNAKERQHLLLELKSIMAVYDARDCH